MAHSSIHSTVDSSKQYQSSCVSTHVNSNSHPSFSKDLLQLGMSPISKPQFRQLTMTSQRRTRLLLLLCTVATFFSCSWAFSAVGRTSVKISRTAAAQSPLAHATRQSPLFSPLALSRRPKSALFFKEDDTSPDTIDGEDDDGDDDVDSQGGILKILFISVPLFCKFCIVLLVKFLTDLVVYPLLWLYRLAHLTKNRILKLFGIDTKKNSASA